MLFWLNISKMEMTSGYGPDVITAAVGSEPTYQMAVEEVAFTARIVCIGSLVSTYNDC